VTLTDKKEIQEVLKNFTENDKILCYTNDAVKAYIKNMRKLQGKPDEIQEGDPVLARNFVESTNCNTHTYADEELIMGDAGQPYIATIQGNLGTYNLKARDITFRNKAGYFKQFIDYKEWNDLLKKLKALQDWKAYYRVKEGFVDIRSSEACTVHCSQGSTYDYVFIDLNDIMTCRQISVKTRLLYVAVSRARKGVYIYG
jgi:superfamily I DNA/RNA helicase